MTAEHGDIEIPIPILKPLWLNQGSAGISQLSVSADAKTIAVGTAEGGIRVLAALNGDVLFEAESQNDLFGINAVQFSPVGDLFASCSEDGWARIHNFRTKEVVWEQRFAKQMPDHPLWSYDGTQFFFTVGKQILRKSVADNQDTEVILEEENTVTAMRWLDRKMIAFTTYGKLKVFEAGSGQVRQNHSWKGSLLSLEICPNKKYAVCGTQDQTIHIWNLATKKDLEMRGFSQKIRQLSFREDGLALAHSAGEEVIVWDFSGQGPAGKKPIQLGPFNQPVVEAKYQNQGSYLATGAKDGIVLFWNPKNGRDPVGISGIQDQEISSIQWAPNDFYLVVGFVTGFVALISFDEDLLVR